MSELFDCVIPAAGASSRMGAWKPFLPWGGGVIVEAVVATALAAAGRVILVAGHRGEELAARFAGRDRVIVAGNPRWELGMLSSLQVGAALVETEAFFVMPADMPLVGPSPYRLLAEARAARSRAGLPEAALFAAAGGELGHPVLIPRAFVPGILALPPGGRLRDHLLGLEHAAVDSGDPAVLADLDRPEDYARARAGLGG